MKKAGAGAEELRGPAEHTTTISSAFLSYLVHKLALYSERGSQEWALALNGSTDDLLAYYKSEFERLLAKQGVQP